jgi:hypothetical protein
VSNENEEKDKFKEEYMRRCLVLGLYIAVFFVFLPSVWAQNADDLDFAVARAKESCNIAGDFEANLYFPSEWEAAESIYFQASLMADRDKSISTLNEAADAFDRLSGLAIPLYAQAREDEIMAVRGYLITMGARRGFPKYMLDAEKTAVQALAQYEAKDYYPARDSAANALEKFNVLEMVFNAWLFKEEIQERGFAAYDPDDFEDGGEILLDAMDAYQEGDLAGAREKAEEALSTYELALSAAWASYAELHSLIAEGERQAALDMKTDIAAREFFNIAEFDNKAALDLLESKQYEDAAKLFINAEAMYVIASITTMEKRRTAVAAIRNANEKIQESDIIARNAEINNKGGQK